MSTEGGVASSGLLVSFESGWGASAFGSSLSDKSDVSSGLLLIESDSLELSTNFPSSVKSFAFPLFSFLPLRFCFV